MDKKAFTLVEIIVVITILAILGLISFIYLQGFTIDARDVKRMSDVKNLITKITIENSKGIDYSQIITNPEKTILKINGTENKEGYQSIEDPINWEILRENKDNFKDPTNGNPYPFAYTEGNANGVGYSFIQLAYVEEKTGTTRLSGNYYEMEPGDSPSLFKGCIGEGNENEIVKDGSCPIYDIGVTYEPPVYANCEVNLNLEGYNVPATNHGQRTGDSSKSIEGGNGTKIASFYCYNGEFKDKQERIECSPGHNSNGTECIQSVPTSCPSGQYLNGTNCEEVGNGNYSGDGETGIHSCPDGGTTETTTASSITECKKLNQTCSGLPNTAYEWHTETITQTHNGTSYQPSLTGTYSANAVSGQCRYKCATNYVHNGTNCVSNSRTQACPALGTGEIRSSTNDTGTKNITQTTTDGTNRAPITTKSYSTDTLADYCYFKCNNGYTLDTSTNTCKSTSGVVDGSQSYTEGGFTRKEITISNGSTQYVIMDRNLGATTAYTGGATESTANTIGSSTFYGNYYQWGRNNTGWTNGDSSNNYDWQTRNDNAWGGANDTTTTTDTSTNKGLRKGPCPTSRHVPSTAEWRGLVYMYVHDIKGISYTSGNSYSSSEIVQAFRYDLKLPRAGRRNRNNGNVNSQGSYGYYWSSSPYSTYGFRMRFYGSNVYPASSNYRAHGFSVRCFKN